MIKSPPAEAQRRQNAESATVLLQMILTALAGLAIGVVLSQLFYG